MGKLRVVIVGAGFGSYGLVPAFRRDDRCEVAAIVTRQWENVVSSKQVDAIAIAVPPVFQPAIALAAMRVLDAPQLAS